MDIGRTSFVTDGPEYSRLSESLQQTHWYAEGHTDPNEDPEDRERARSYARLEEEERRKKEELERKKLADEESGVASQSRSSSDEGEGASSRPRDTQELSPASRNRKAGERAAQSRSNNGQRERTGPNGSSADDESSPPSNSPPKSPTSSTGAQYMPAASIQEDSRNPEHAALIQREASPERNPNRARPPKLPFHRRCMRIGSSAWALILTGLIFAFALFSYLSVAMWLDMNLNKLITERVQLRQGHLTPSPAKQNANVRLEVVFYNVTYTLDAKGKPQIYIKDMGPYTYLVQSHKTDVIWNSNRTVSYRIKETFHFQPNRSAGSQNDVINTMDADVLAKLSKMEVKNHSKPFYVNVTKEMVKPQTVGDFLWGKGDAAGGRRGKGMLPDNKSNKLFRKENTPKKSNESISPMYNVYTGEKNIQRVNEMYTFNFSRTNRMWPYGHDHYPKSGSADGDFFQPRINGQTLSFFYSQTERNLLIEKAKSVSVNGHLAHRYTLAKYPQNKGHNHTANDDDNSSGATQAPSDIEDEQVITLTEGDIRDDAPREGFALEYLRPDSPFLVTFQPPVFHGSQGNGSDMCTMHLDIHPASGMTLRKRLCHQMSLPVVYPGPKGEGYILPIMWVDWFYESMPDELDALKTSSDMLQIGTQATTVFLCISIIFCVLFVLQLISWGLRISFENESQIVSM